MSDPLTIRRDGWTSPRQLLFLQVFARTRSVTAAAAAAGMAREGAYRLRRRAPASLFAMTWALLEGRTSAIGKGHAASGDSSPAAPEVRSGRSRSS